MAEIRSFCAYLVGNVEVDFYSALVRNGREMKHTVGRTADSHVNRESVHKCFAGHDVARADTLLNHIHNRHTRLFGKNYSVGINSGDGAVSGKTHAQSLGKAVHGVGGVHSGAGAAGGAGSALEITELILVDESGVKLADSLGYGGKACPLAVDVSGKHGSPAYKNGWDVKPSRSHKKSRDVLVAVWNHNKPVKSVSHCHSLGGIGNKVAGDKRILHSDMPHCNAVANGDSRKDYGSASSHGNTCSYRFDNLVDVHVTGYDFIV